MSESDSKALSKELVKGGLSVLGKHPVLLKHSYLECKVNGADVTDITILSEYPHLMYVNMSQNKITNLDVLSQLPSLVQLDVSHNACTDCLSFVPKKCIPENSWSEGDTSFGSMLTLVNLSYNSLSRLTSLDHHPYLETLILSNNKISEIEGISKLKFLKVLDLSYNTLTEIKGLDNLQIQELNLEGNVIEEIANLEYLPRLSSLNISRNKIKSLSALEKCVHLMVLNCGNNLLEHLRQTVNLAELPLLTSLTMMGNPCCMKRLYRRRVLYRLQKLLKLDQSDVTAEELIESLDLYDDAVNGVFEDDENMLVLPGGAPTKDTREYWADMARALGNQQEKYDRVMASATLKEAEKSYFDMKDQYIQEQM